MTTFILDSKSTSNNKTYFSSFSRWCDLIKGHGYSNLLPDPIHIDLYITHLVDTKCPANVIKIMFIVWKGLMYWIVFSDPTENSFVQSHQASTKWLSSKPVNNKNPVTSHMIVHLCSQFTNSNDLMIVRDLAMIILNFSGFLRFDELNSLKYNNVTVDNYVLKLNIVHS